MEKEKLRQAYEAGKASVEQNSDRSHRLDTGVKQIEEEYNFENWYFNQQPELELKDVKSFKLMLGVIG